MKIALLTRAFDKNEGPGIASINLIDSLIDNDRDNQYVAFHMNKEFLGRYKYFENVKEILVHASNKLVYDQLFVPWLSYKEGVDIIFSPKFAIPLLTNKKCVTTMRGSEYWAFPERYNKVDLLYVNFFIPRYCKKASKVVTISNSLRDDMQKYLHVRKDKMVTIYNAANDHFRPIKDKAALEKVRVRYNLPKERFILTVSRAYAAIGFDDKNTYPTKNTAGVIKSFLRCSEHLQENIKLVIVGRNIKEDLISNGDKLGITNNDNLVFPGLIPQEDMPALYALSELLIFPSYYESFGLPLVEAMSCGCPVITSNVTACPEIVGDSAVIVDPDDISAMERGLYKILTDKKYAKSLSNNGLTHAQDYSWDNSAKKLLEIFEGIGKTLH